MNNDKHFQTWLRFAVRHAKRGVTLLELMAVIIVVLLISTIVMRSIGPALKERRIREGARMLSTILNSARNRAMQIGRSTGVWIDRVPGLPEAAMTVSYAQVPEVYTGEVYTSGVEAFVWPDPVASPNLNYYLNLIRSNNTPGSTTIPTAEFWGTPPLDNSIQQQKYFRAGDSIRINCAGEPFPMEASNSRLFTTLRPPASPISAPLWVIGVGTNYKRYFDFIKNSGVGNTITLSTTTTSTDPVLKRFTNVWDWIDGTNGSPVSHTKVKWFNTAGSPSSVLPIVTPGSTMTDTAGNTLPFQILRQPMRTSGGAIQLPEGTIIDLNYSGILFNNSVSNAFTPFLVRWLSADQNYVTARGFRGTYDNPPPELGTINSQPIILTFSPGGSVDKLYTPYWQDTSSSSGEWRWGNYPAVQMAVFMIGSASKVPAKVPATSSTTDPDANIAVQMDNNWTDIQNLYVGVSTDTGYIMTTEMKSPFVAGGTPIVVSGASIGGTTINPTTATISTQAGYFIRSYIGGDNNFLGITNNLRWRRVMGGAR